MWGAGRMYFATAIGLGACLSVLSASVAAAAPAAPATTQTDNAYRINPGDQIEIYVWGEERLQRVVSVLPDGTFAFPLAGQVSAQGKLPQDIEKILTERLRDQYRNQVPQITVSVKAPTGLQFSVLGKVKSPGAFSPGRYVNVIEALSLAGGAAEFANLDGVMLLRKSGNQLTSTRLRLSAIFKAGATANDIDKAAIPRVESGDTIIVP